MDGSKFAFVMLVIGALICFVPGGAEGAVGDPISDGWVDMEGDCGYNDTSSDENGSYSMGVQGNLTSWYGGGEGYFENGSSYYMEPIPLEENGTYWFDIDLTPMPANSSWIKGYVTDRRNGTALRPDMDLDWEDDLGNDMWDIIPWDFMPDEEGYFEIHLPAGDIEISFYHEGYYPVFDTSFSIYAGETKWVNITMMPELDPVGWLMGYVWYENGTGVEDIRAEADGMDRLGMWGGNYSWTNQSGYYKMMLPAGIYNASLYFPSYVGYYYPVDEVMFNVTFNSTSWANFTIEPIPTFNFSIRVLNGSNRTEYLSDTTVYWYEYYNMTQSFSGSMYTNDWGWANFTLFVANFSLNVYKWFSVYSANYTYVNVTGEGSHIVYLWPVEEDTWKCYETMVMGNLTEGMYTGMPSGWFDDFDGDSLNDTWELLYDLDPTWDDSDNDTDGDGWSNYYEHYHKTDPTDNESYPGMVMHDYSVLLTLNRSGDSDVEMDKGQSYSFDVIVNNTGDGADRYQMWAEFNGTLVDVSFDPVHVKPEGALAPQWHWVVEVMIDGLIAGDGEIILWVSSLTTDAEDNLTVMFDVLPPSAPPKVSDFMAKNVDDNEVTLGWTSVGDYVYEIGMHTEAFTNLSLEDILWFDDLEDAKQTGGSEVFTIDELLEATQYWFVLVLFGEEDLSTTSDIITATTTQTVGEGNETINASTGGKVTVGNRVEIDIPADALGSDTKITATVKSSDVGSPATPTLYLASNYYEFGPTGLTFDKPVTVTLKYDASKLPAGTTEDDLAVYKWNPTTSSWDKVPGAAIDKTAGTISVDLTSFSRYAVMAKQAADPAGDDEDDDEEDSTVMMVMLLIVIIVLLVVIFVALGKKGKEQDLPEEDEAMDDEPAEDEELNEEKGDEASEDKEDAPDEEEPAKAKKGSPPPGGASEEADDDHDGPLEGDDRDGYEGVGPKYN